MPLYLPEADFFVPAGVTDYRFRRNLYDKAFHSPLVLHLSHKGCLDGVTCDFLVRRAYGPGAVDTVFIDPHETASVLELITQVPGRARTLVVSDLSFQKGQGGRIAVALGALSDIGWRIVWRDHHHKQWEGADLDALEAHAKVTVDFATSECGATLVQKDLLPHDDGARELAEVVRDHDLWLRKDPRSGVLSDAFHEMGPERYLAVLGKRASPDAPEFAAAAKAHRRTKDRLVKRGIEQARILTRNGARVAVVWGNFPTNEVLHGLQEAQKVDVGILLKPSGTFSLRSRKGMEVCHLIAQPFGGGGHPNASGGKLPLEGGAYLAYWARRARHPEAERLVATALEVVASPAARAEAV